METVTERPVEVPVEVDDDLHFLTDWEVLQDRQRTRTARIASVLVHVALILTLLFLPNSVTAPVREAVVRRITPLIEPLTDLTQNQPNRGKINKEFNVESQAPRPRVHIPAMPARARLRARHPAARAKMC